MNKKLLCPVDGSAASAKAAAYALQLARLLDIPLSFVSVYTNGAHLHPAAEILSGPALDADPVLGPTVRAFDETGGPHIRYIRIYGKDIAGTLVEFAETDQYDHIVMGSNGRRGMKRLLIGSVASEVIQRAHCPVTVVR